MRLLSFSKVIDFLESGEFFFWGFKVFWKLRIFVSFLGGFLGLKFFFVSKNWVYFRVNGHFLSKTNGSGTKKFISFQKPTVLGQKSPFPHKNQRFLGKKVHFLSKIDGSRGKRGKRDEGGVRFEKEGNAFSKKYRISQYPEKFKSKKRRKSDFFLFSYYKKWNLGIWELWRLEKSGRTT